MSETNKKQDQVLDMLFAEAKAADPIPSGDLMARILADASAVQKQAAVTAVRPVARRGMFQNLSDALGGWAGLSTLAACVCLGVVVGFASPDAVMSYFPSGELGTTDDPFELFFDGEL